MDNLENLKRNALDQMKKEGFGITEDIDLAINEKLPFMGYTTERNGKTLIVISRWSLTSGRVMGLLIHELSHVYRTETNHPSHNFVLHDKVLQRVLQGGRLYSYQEEIMRNAINNLQDLYADDISFKVHFKESKDSNMNEFFLGWVHDPFKNPKTVKEKWKNAGSLLNASFASANLKRHNVEDTDGKVKKAVQNFLNSSEKKVAKKYNYFEDVMINLPEKVSSRDFEKLLSNYLTEFLKLI